MKHYEQTGRPHYQVIKTIDKYYAGIEPETHCSQRAWCPEPRGYPCSLIYYALYIDYMHKSYFFFMKPIQRFSVKDPLKDCL